MMKSLSTIVAMVLILCTTALHAIAASSATTAAITNLNNSPYVAIPTEGAAYDSMLYFKMVPLYLDGQGLIVGLCELSWGSKTNCKTFIQLADESGCEMKSFTYMPYRNEIIIYCMRRGK